MGFKYPLSQYRNVLKGNFIDELCHDPNGNLRSVSENPKTPSQIPIPPTPTNALPISEEPGPVSILIIQFISTRQTLIPSTPLPSGRSGPPSRAGSSRRGGTLGHQLGQTQVPPSRLAGFLSSLLHAIRRMLVRNNIVFFLRVDGLQVGRDVDVVLRESVLAEVLEQVGVMRVVEVDVGETAVFVLSRARPC